VSLYLLPLIIAATALDGALRWAGRVDNRLLFGADVFLPSAWVMATRCIRTAFNLHVLEWGELPGERGADRELRHHHVGVHPRSATANIAIALARALRDEQVVALGTFAAGRRTNWARRSRHSRAHKGTGAPVRRRPGPARDLQLLRTQVDLQAHHHQPDHRAGWRVPDRPSGRASRSSWPAVAEKWALIAAWCGSTCAAAARARAQIVGEETVRQTLINILNNVRGRLPARGGDLRAPETLPNSPSKVRDRRSRHYPMTSPRRRDAFLQHQGGGTRNRTVPGQCHHRAPGWQRGAFNRDGGGGCTGGRFH